MNIIRTVKDKRGKYEKIDHRPLEDERLSYAARGVLGYLLTKPPGWKIQPEDLLRRQPEARRLGRDGVRAVFRELISFGYMSRHQVHREDGTFEWEHRVYESPFMNPHFSQISPSTPNQTLDSQTLDDQTLGSQRRQRRRYSNYTHEAITHEAITHESNNTHSAQERTGVSGEKSEWDHKTRKEYARVHKLGAGWLVVSETGKFDQVVGDWVEACRVAAQTCKACGKTSPCELADQGDCYHPDVCERMRPDDEIREVAG